MNARAHLITQIFERTKMNILPYIGRIIRKLLELEVISTFALSVSYAKNGIIPSIRTNLSAKKFSLIFT